MRLTALQRKETCRSSPISQVGTARVPILIAPILGPTPGSSNKPSDETCNQTIIPRQGLRSLIPMLCGTSPSAAAKIWRHYSLSFKSTMHVEIKFTSAVFLKYSVFRLQKPCSSERQQPLVVYSRLGSHKPLCRCNLESACLWMIGDSRA